MGQDREIDFQAMFCCKSSVEVPKVWGMHLWYRKMRSASVL